jgi:hypothetical protein
MRAPGAAVGRAATPDAATAVTAIDCYTAAIAAGSRTTPDRTPGVVPSGDVS